MFVSVIVPCFNQAQFLEEAVLSVLSQTYTYWECIIVNDGSLDNTKEIALRLCKKDVRIRYVDKQNGGLSSARNAGIAVATGNFIQLLDSDDLLENDKLKVALDFYKEKSGQVIAFSGSRYFETYNPKAFLILGRNSQIAHIDLDYADSFEAQKQVLRTCNPCVISAPLYSIQVFKQVGLFDEKLKALEDWDFHLRCLKSGFKFHYIGNRILGRTLIRLHDYSMMRNVDHMNKNYETFARKHGFWKTDTTPMRKNKFKEVLRDIIPPILLKIMR